MNFPPPRWIRQAAEEALNSVPSNHYSHPKGRIRLREALKAFYDPLFKRDLSVDSEILVTSGANEGIPYFHLPIRAYAHSKCSGEYSVFTAFLEQGDEVIMFEPFFDQYLPSVVFNGGKPVYVPLHPPAQSLEKPTSNDWTIDFDELRYVFVLPVVND
jgi:kynurenine aminotransferase